MLVVAGAVIAASALVLTAAALGIGRDGGSPSTPTVSGPSIQPGPGATLATASGAKHAASAGTRCWGGACIDYIGPVTNVQPIALRPGERVTIAFEPGTPKQHTLQWLPVSGDAPHPGPDGIAWPMPPTGGVAADPANITAPSATGSYLLVSFAWWDRGDASHAWYVSVR